MAKLLKSTQAPSIHPDEITLIFPNDKPYPWRRPHDVTIDPHDTEHPLHDLYDERVLDAVPQETINNIRELGIGQPVTLIERNGVIYKVDGAQRIKARRMANDLNQKEGYPDGYVPYIQSTEKDVAVLSALRVTLNEHRKDDAMLTKAKRAQHLITRFNWTPAQASTYFNVSITAIKNWLAMLDKCAPQVLKAVEKGKIAATTALNYSKLPVDEQAEALERDLAAIEGRTQVRSKKEKKLSGSEVAKKRELSPEQQAEKRFQKVMDLLEEMSAEERLKVFARFDVETGEEAPLATASDYLEEEGDVKVAELTTEYDDEIIEAESKPTIKRRKRAAKK